MTSEELIKQFWESWKYSRSLTLSAIKKVPETHWDWSPREGFATFSKQVRHLICVQGVYNDALKTKKMDFSQKHSHYSGELQRGALVEALRIKDIELLSKLEDLKRTDLLEFKIDYFGTPLNFMEFFSALMDHEAMHRGQWHFYASLGGYAKESSE